MTHPAAPARIAILSDVHGNLPAFRAVIDDARAADVDAVWCLGDLVGYGASPDECVALAQAECDVLLGGNHDLAVAGRIELSDFSPAAAAAARWTREHASADTLALLESLAPAQEDERIGLYHGSPTDPIWEYVLSTEQAGQSFDAMSPRVGAIGHTHVALRFTRRDGQLYGEQTPAGPSTTSPRTSVGELGPPHSLTATWRTEYDQWCRRFLADRDFLYVWVDGGPCQHSVGRRSLSRLSRRRGPPR